MLSYDPGRNDANRETCTTCLTPDCNCYDPVDHLWVPITNTKAFLNAGVGLGSWSGRLEIIRYEAHDNGLSLEALESGFWIDQMLTTCRTGEPIALPPDAQITRIPGDGFFWYDTGQEHIITDSKFRSCGYRSDEFNQYNTSPDRGCGDDPSTGCASDSTVFGFLAHSDQFNPEVMQGTARITEENNGRRFRLHNFRQDQAVTVSGRDANWLDVDGSVTGFGVRSFITSGFAECGLWWAVDDNTVHDTQGPLTFINSLDGPERGLAHVRMEWDNSLHNQVGGALCVNGGSNPCPPVGSIRHRGERFVADDGMPVTANAEIAGLAGGFGWFLDISAGAPREIRFSHVEVDPGTPLLFSIAYPTGTTFDVTQHAAPWCWYDPDFPCEQSFFAVSSIEDVRNSEGNTYHVSDDGVLTFRILQATRDFVGRPDWFLPTWDSLDRWDQWYALDRFERKDVFLPRFWYGPELVVTASCSSGTYCSNAGTPTSVDDVCPSGFTQVSYDRCCLGSQCVFADGSGTTL